MAIKCCYGCVPPKRQIGCHSTCPEYLQERKKHDDERKIEQEAKDRLGVEYRSKRVAIRRAIEHKNKR